MRVVSNCPSGGHFFSPGVKMKMKAVFNAPFVVGQGSSSVS